MPPVDLGVVLACWCGFSALFAPLMGAWLRRVRERYERRGK